MHYGRGSSLSFHQVDPDPKGGWRRVPNRLALSEILFISRTRTAWELLPPELGCGSGLSCWRRLWDWQVAGVWQKVWKALLDELGVTDKIDWSKAVVDSSSVRALFGGRKLAPIPRIAAKTGQKGMSSATAKASRSRRSIPARMFTIPKPPCLWWIPFLPSRGRGRQETQAR